MMENKIQDTYKMYINVHNIYQQSTNQISVYIPDSLYL